jgi:hypothetical protein
MAGYSGTPLPQKLGIKAGARVGVFSAPKGFRATLGDLPPGTKLEDAAKARGPFDVVVAFFTERQQLERAFEKLKAKLLENGGLWIAWPKKTSGVVTDITEDTLRTVGLPRGVVDNKVCAIDEVWSGLRFVYRLSERTAKPKKARATRPAR